MGRADEEEIVEGISFTPSGEARVSNAMGHVVFDIALELEEHTDFPVDVQHVVAALVMGVQEGSIARGCRISAGDSGLNKTLTGIVDRIFRTTHGQVSRDD